MANIMQRLECNEYYHMQAHGPQRLLEALGPHLAPTISRMKVILMRSPAPTLGVKL